MPDYQLAAFFKRVSLIIKDRSQGVSENRDGLFKRHPVLLQIAFRFRRIPVELHGSDYSLSVTSAEQRIGKTGMSHGFTKELAIPVTLSTTFPIDIL